MDSCPPGQINLCIQTCNPGNNVSGTLVHWGAESLGDQSLAAGPEHSGNKVEPPKPAEQGDKGSDSPVQKGADAVREAANSVGERNQQMLEDKKKHESPDREPSNESGKIYPPSKGLLEQLKATVNDVATAAGKVAEGIKDAADKVSDKVSSQLLLTTATEGISSLTPDLSKQIKEVGKHFKDLEKYVSPDSQQALRDVSGGLSDFMKSLPSFNGVSIERDPKSG